MKKKFWYIAIKVFGYARMKEYLYWRITGKKLDLRNPKNLVEKMCYLAVKKYPKDELVIKCTSKAGAKEYLIEQGKENIVIPTLGIYDEAELIDFEILPEKFILKVTQGCGMNIICKDKKNFNQGQARKQLNEWVNIVYGIEDLEPHYVKVKREIICEELLELENVIDYKFHCLNGEPSFILTCSDRTNGVKLNAFDLEWNKIPHALKAEYQNDENIEKPKTLSTMVELCRELAKPFEFVRIDLYEVNGKVLFGEFTFSPAGGFVLYFTDEFVEEQGRKLEIKK